MKKILVGFLAVSCLSFASLAFAAHPLATDDTGTQGKMKFQLETTGEFSWDKETENGTTTKSNSQVLTNTLTAGVSDSVDLALAYPFTWQHIEGPTSKIDNSGLNDLSLTLKYRFLELGPASFALKPCLTFPTASRDRSLGAGRTSYGVTLISTLDLKPVTLHANVGYTRQKYTDADKDGSREHLTKFSLAGTVEVLKGLLLVTEVGTSTNQHTESKVWPTFVTGGVIYSVLENLDLDLGVTGGLNATATDIALLAGLTFRFP